MSESLDLRIPDAIVHRLDGVDAAIERADHVRMSRPPGLLVVPGRVVIREARRTALAPSLKVSRGMAAVILATVLTTAGALTALESLSPSTATPSKPGASAAVGQTGGSPEPTPTGSVAASASASASAAASGAPGSMPPLEPTPRPDVRTVRVAGSAIPTVQKELRAPCLGKATEPEKPPTKTFVLSAAGRATGPGWLDAAQTVWYGPSPIDAAAAFGARALVSGADGNWVIRGDPKKAEARSLVGLETGAGTAYWLATRLVAAACR